jgi:Ca2+-transporting ATPase
MQLLWINIITDVFPGLALGLDPPEPDVLDRSPRDPSRPIFETRDFRRIAAEGGVITLAAILSELYGGRRAGGGDPRGFGFTTLTVAQLLMALSCRSEKRPVFGAHRLPPNRYLRWALGSLLALQGAAALLPGTRGLLGLTGMRGRDLAAAWAFGALPFLGVEAAKMIARAGPSDNEEARP